MRIHARFVKGLHAKAQARTIFCAETERYSIFLNVSLGLLKSTVVVSAMTTLSRILGLVRDIVIARYFGAGLGMDAFIVAFRIPNLLRRLFAEGSFSQAFVPVLSEYKETRGAEEMRALVDQTTAVLGLVLLGVTAIGVLAAPWLVLVFAPGFAGEADKQQLASQMLRITFPYILFISLTALAGGILNTFRRFAIPAFTPVLLNLSMIFAAIWLAPRLPSPIVALAWGVFLAGVVQLLFQVPFVLKLGLLPRPSLSRDRDGVRRIFKLMIPALFAVSVTQINLLVDTLVASFLVTGSISWLYYSDRMVEFPLGVFGIALATVIMPSLSAEHARGSSDSYNRTLDWALRWVFLISVPAAIGLAALAAPALATLFQYEQFTAHDVTMASRSLVAYCLGLPAFILVKVLASGFFARQDTRTPVRAGVIAMLCNIALLLALVLPLAHAGLALATSLAAYINAGILYRQLRRRSGLVLQAGWGRFLLQVGAAVLAMWLLLALATPSIESWIASGVRHRVVQLALWIVAGSACYFAVLRLCGLRVLQMAHH
ncbi:MAG: murein biosynthesis integral membrane protein MurJ [Gammaproteobacteria bacterium]|nr:murein biosynthesis integral membrane protein MurJ [Gammaproteobacteria bacterium]